MSPIMAERRDAVEWFSGADATGAAGPGSADVLERLAHGER
jgi:hypothetical protein